MPSIGHVILHGFLNFFNQVYLLLYKNVTRVIRSPWTWIIFLFFPSIMLGILYGLHTSIARLETETASTPDLSKCTTQEAPFKCSSCISLGYSTDPYNPSAAPIAHLTMAVLANHLGWSISPTPGDLSLDYDVVYFGNTTVLQDYNYYGDKWIKYIVTHDSTYSYFYYYDASMLSPENYYVQYGGPTPVNMRGFGFRNTLTNKAAASTAKLKTLLQDAHIAARQAQVNGWTASQAIMPSIKLDIQQLVANESLYPYYVTDTTTPTSDSTTELFWLFAAPVFIWIGLFASQLVLSSQILEDRRKKLRLGLKLAGLNTGAYQLSWFIFHIGLSAIYSAIAMLIGYATGLPFFRNTNMAVIFFFFWCSSVAAIGFTLFTSALIHHPTGHTVIMVLLFLVGVVLSAFSANPIVQRVFWPSDTAKVIWIFNYNFQFGNIMSQIDQVVYEDLGNASIINSTHYEWHDIYVDPGHPHLPSVSASFGYLLLCGVLALITSIYLEIVFPREIGQPQSFFFFFFPSYWGFSTSSRLNVETVEHRSDKMSDVAADLDPDVMGESQDVMKRINAKDPRLAVAIIKLSKTFQKKLIASSQDTRALDFLTLGADEGSVLGIVGHNGAGKTTLISMLCGIMPVSAGDARIFGHSVTQDMSSIHRVMGVCPQEDTLWPELTGYQHLKLFAMLKRVPWREQDKVIKESLQEVGLLNVRNRVVNKYSGGMKRRLSVAIALLGDVRILMLDEPTAGLDPKNRLEIWSIIERVKKNRVVILTTHSMQEASVLADKIAVLAVGRLRGIGSPQHLTNRFGKGHQINLVSKMAVREEVKALMKKHLPDAQLEVDTGARLMYSLPNSKSKQLPDFCNYMETEGMKSGLLDDWGISQTTLEQVFLRLTHGGGNQSTSNSASSQLNICYEDSDDFLGFVPILPTTTLDQVRDSMSENEAFPKDFTFIFNRAPVTRPQESYTIAYKALPVIELRLPSDATDVAPPRTKKPKKARAAQKVEPADSTAEAAPTPISDPATSSSNNTSVAALQQRIVHLEQLVDKLQKENDELRKQIATQ